MAAAKKTAAKKTTQSEEQKARQERVTGGQPVTQSGLGGPTQDELNPAFGPKGAEPDSDSE